MRCDHVLTQVLVELRQRRTDPWAAREVINDLNATEHWPQIILGEVDLLKSEARAREQVRDVLLLD